MKTKLVQHVESDWMRDWKSVRVRKSENERVRECESVRVTFEHKHENKSCSACGEWVNERVKEWECESERVTFEHRHENKSCSVWREWECERVIWFPAFVWHSDIFFLSSQCSRSWNSSPIFTFTSSIIEHNEHSLINTSTIQPPLLSSKSRWRFFNQNIDKFVWNKWPESLSPARIFSSPLINTSLKSVYYIEARFHN